MFQFRNRLPTAIRPVIALAGSETEMGNATLLCKKRRILVTNHHIAAAAKDALLVVLPNGDVEQCEIIPSASDEKSDIAFFRMRSDLGLHNKRLRVPFLAAPDPGILLFTSGYLLRETTFWRLLVPGYLSQPALEGYPEFDRFLEELEKVTGKTRDEFVGFLCTSHEITPFRRIHSFIPSLTQRAVVPGMSGSPTFDHERRMVGMICRGNTNARYALSIPARTIQILLDKIS